MVEKGGFLDAQELSDPLHSRTFRALCGRIVGCRLDNPFALWVPSRSFAHYDDGWQLEPGTFRILVGQYSPGDFQVLDAIR